MRVSNIPRLKAPARVLPRRENCCAAEFFQRAAFEGKARQEARACVIRFFDPAVTGYTAQSLARDLARIAKDAGGLEKAIEAYPGIKQEVMKAAYPGISILSAVILVPEEELKSRCDNLGRLYIESGTEKIYPLRTRRAQLHYCVLTSEAKILERAKLLIEEQGFTQEVFDANPHVFEGSAKRVTDGQAAQAFLAAARGMIREEQYAEARSCIDKAKKYPERGVRPEIAAGVRSLDEGLRYFMAAQQVKKMDEKQKLLAAAYRACLRYEREGTVGQEASHCAPLVEKIKDAMVETYYMGFALKAAAAERKLAQRREAADPARGFLEERQLRREAAELEITLQLLVDLRKRLEKKGLFGAFVLVFFAAQEKMAVAGDLRQALDEEAEKIILELTGKGLLKVGFFDKAGFAGLSRMGLAAKALVAFDRQEKPGCAEMVLVLERYIQEIAARQVEGREEEQGMALLAELAARQGLPFTQVESTVIERNGLAADAIRWLQEEGAGKKGGWGEFYRSVKRALPEAILALCGRYSVPPFMVWEKCSRDPQVLEGIFRGLEERHLLGLIRIGLGKNWLISDTDEFKKTADAAKGRIDDLMPVLVDFGIPDQEHPAIVALLMVKGNLRSDSIIALQVLARMLKAAELKGEKQQQARELLADYFVSFGKLFNLCERLLTIAEGQRDVLLAGFEGIKGQAMRFNKGRVDKLAALAFADEAELSGYVDSLEKLDVEAGGSRIFPFRALEARLCVCVCNDIPRKIEEAERMIEQYHFDQEVFDANPGLLDSRMEVESALSIAKVFRRTARRVLVEKKDAQTALVYARRAKQWVENQPDNSFAADVMGFENALSLYLAAREMRKRGKPVDEILAALESARKACRRKGRGGISPVRRPIAQLVGRMQEELSTASDAPPGRYEYEPVLEEIRAGHFAAAKEKLNGRGALKPLRIYLQYLLDGRAALREKNYAAAIKLLRRAQAVVVCEEHLSFLPEQCKLGLSDRVVPDLEFARGSAALEKGEIDAAFLILSALLRNHGNGFSHLKDLASGYRPEAALPGEVKANVAILIRLQESMREVLVGMR